MKEHLSRKRICVDCKEWQSAKNFVIITKKYTYRRTGEVKNLYYRNSVCRVCMCNRTKKWRKENYEKDKQYHKEYARKKAKSGS